MNRIDNLFQEKRKKILSVYFTAGFPGLQDTLSITEVLEKSGVEMVEIGIPFSDPLADGPVLQESNQKALENGMSLRLLFKQLENIRRTVNIPLILMGYLNPVLQFGVEAFCIHARECGIDGIILPDLPLEVYAKDYKQTFEKNGLHKIFLVTPQTGEEKIWMIDREGNGFIYLVTSSSTTGEKKELGEEQVQYLRRINSMKLRLPLMAGFGISSRSTFLAACQYTNGAIIGSAFVRAIGGEGDLKKKISDFINNFLQIN